MIAAIVCIDENNGIGNEGKLLVRIKEDMKMFNEITKKGSVIMGRKTWESLNKKPLKNRTNIVITHVNRNKKLKVQSNGVINVNMERIKAWLSDDEVIKTNNGIYIIGGEQIYKELLPLCERVYITKVLQKFDADTYFPDITQMPEWELTSVSEIKKENGIEYQFYVYDRTDYSIIDIQEQPDSDNKNNNSLIITVKTFQGYKIITIRIDDNEHVSIFFDDKKGDWEYLFTQDNLQKFIDRAISYNKEREENRLKNNKPESGESE